MTGVSLDLSLSRIDLGRYILYFMPFKTVRCVMGTLMPANLPTFVRSPSEVVANVKTFAAAVDANTKLQDRLAYVRSWYAFRQKNDWRFAPSKWIGYREITPDGYLTSAHLMDGRKTEALLRRWWQPLDPSSTQHDELLDSLAVFLARYGKQPNSEARITVIEETEPDEENDFADLIVKVVRGLGSAQKARIINALKG